MRRTALKSSVFVGSSEDTPRDLRKRIEMNKCGPKRIFGVTFSKSNDETRQNGENCVVKIESTNQMMGVVDRNGMW